jgi:hypothetical protein
MIWLERERSGQMHVLKPERETVARETHEIATASRRFLLEVFRLRLLRSRQLGSPEAEHESLSIPRVEFDSHPHC